MSEKTNIEWANHTGGPWLICSMISEGCRNCYAMLLMLTRLGPLVRRAYKAAGFQDWETRPIWGEKATRVLSKGFWGDARRINAVHAKAGTRGRWFPSMIDWLDEMPAGIIDQDGNKLEPIAVLVDFLKLIYDTPNLDWLLLTKRPENFADRLYQAALHLPMVGEGIQYQHWVNNWRGIEPPSNVWVGVSVEDQKRADERIPLLLQIPAKVRFLSVEPLLSEIDFRPHLYTMHYVAQDHIDYEKRGGLHWAIIGGESGKGRRDCGVEAIQRAALQFKNAQIPVFTKQDSAFKPGQRGRLSDEVWALKQFPL